MSLLLQLTLTGIRLILTTMGTKFTEVGIVNLSLNSEFKSQLVCPHLGGDLK